MNIIDNIVLYIKLEPSDNVLLFKIAEYWILDFPLKLETSKPINFFKMLTKNEQTRILNFFQVSFLRDLMQSVPSLQDNLLYLSFVFNYDQPHLTPNPNYSYEDGINIFGKRIDQINPLRLCTERSMMLLVGLHLIKISKDHYANRSRLVGYLMNLLQIYRNPKGSPEKEVLTIRGNIINIIYIIIVYFPDIIKDVSGLALTQSNKANFESQPLNHVELGRNPQDLLDKLYKGGECCVRALRATLMIFLKNLIKESSREGDICKAHIMLLSIYGLYNQTQSMFLHTYFSAKLPTLRHVGLKDNSKLKFFNPKLEEQGVIKATIDEILNVPEKKIYTWEDICKRERNEIVNVHFDIADYLCSFFHLVKFTMLPVPHPKEITPNEEFFYNFLVHDRITGYFVNAKFSNTLQEILADSTLRLLQNVFIGMGPKYDTFIRGINDLFFLITTGQKNELKKQVNYRRPEAPIKPVQNMNFPSNQTKFSPPIALQKISPFTIEAHRNQKDLNPKNSLMHLPRLPAQMLEADLVMDFR